MTDISICRAPGRKNAEAIEIYSTKIELEPTSQTLYLGRAKARFLAGDVRGAVEDLDRVDELAGSGSLTHRLRGIIERGDNPRTILDPVHTHPNYSQALRNVMEALEAGDGVRAFEGYTSLDEIGFNRALSLLRLKGIPAAPRASCQV
jgi:hypothetical protein